MNDCNPNLMQEEQIAWGILRRIGAVGMLWNKPSDAWLGIDGLKAVNRKDTFKKLLADNKIVEISIENIADKFYCLSEDKLLIKRVLNNNDFVGRTEFIAPLDNMLWDRKLIKLIFNFEYKWEIYTPIVKRKFGHYVLPVLSGDRFTSRIEIVNDKKTKQLIVKNLWLEEDFNNSDISTEDINECLKRFSGFNNCEQIKIQCKI
ncbi:DNA glycosylase AlkZ-like family protein [Clostridium sp.]|uniref:DNA glycosylase AlkZ-like family protein n=1 Tax=Clostridium sp. TaxID=1506 RepID=UPI003D6D789A